MSDTDQQRSDTVEELERQAANQAQEEQIAGALAEARELFEGETAKDRYQEREERRQRRFNQLHGEDETDPTETGRYLENHHEWERSESDGQGDT